MLYREPVYFWRRINIIALEEIGIADPMLVSQVLWVSGKTAWRQKHGGDNAIAFPLILRMCESPKDRNAAEIPQTLALHSQWEDMWNELGILHQQDLKLIALECRDDLWRFLYALWLYANGRVNEKLEFRITRDRIPELDSVFADMAAPEDIRGLFYLATRKTTECLSIGVIGAWLLSRGKERSFATEHLPSNEWVNGFPLYAYDKHTRKGKQALSAFAKIPALQNFFDRYTVTNQTEAVGHAVFELESQRVKYRLVYDGWFEPMRLSTIAWLERTGLNQKIVPDFLKLIGQNIELLNTCRVYTLCD